MAKSRNWDRSPESKRDKKFHDLRDSGYKGPIDEKGNAVSENEMRRRMDKTRGNR